MKFMMNNCQELFVSFSNFNRQLLRYTPVLSIIAHKPVRDQLTRSCPFITITSGIPLSHTLQSFKCLFGITISLIPIAMTTTTGYDAYMADGQVAFVTGESFSHRSTHRCGSDSDSNVDALFQGILEDGGS